MTNHTMNLKQPVYTKFQYRPFQLGQIGRARNHALPETKNIKFHIKKFKWFQKAENLFSIHYLSVYQLTFINISGL